MDSTPGVMQEEQFVEAIPSLLEKEGIFFSREQAQLCYRHVLLMIEWNRRMNLTRITDLREILVRHVLDSLLPARWLPRHGLALDVGTGPGFPGMPLKILYPNLKMVLLEAHRKKVSFLKVVLSRLPLEEIWALQGRWEELPRIDHFAARQRYDLITMRAVRLQPEHLDPLAAGMLRPGGTFAWWAGPGAHRDGESSPSLLASLPMVFEGRFSYTLPSLSNPRHLLVWRRRD